MPDPHPILALLLSQNAFVGKAQEFEQKVRMLPIQAAFGVGDAAMLSSTSVPLEQDTAFVRGIPLGEYLEQFPDHKERMALNDVVFCEHFSSNDREISVGWFPRIKLMPIPNERYDEARSWLEDDWPEEMPEWMFEIFKDYTDQLSANAPDMVPKLVICPTCGGHKVAMIAVRHTVMRGPAGSVEREGEHYFIPLSDMEEETGYSARLDCTDCGSYADLEEGTWHVKVFD